MRILSILIFILVHINAFAEARLITVEGEAKRDFRPDMVYLNISINAKEKIAKTAQINEARLFESVKKIVDRNKIPSKDFETTHYSLNQDFIYDNKTNRSISNGYIVRQNLKIVLRDLKQVGIFLDEIISISEKETTINIDSVSGHLEKNDDLQNEIITEAVKNAKYRATVLANAAGVKIKNIYQINPERSEPQYPQYESRMLMAAAPKALTDIPTQINLGDVSLSANVKIQFEIE
jgi:uncharacterized protein YggE